jgi:DNA-binding response OmpR family regulator
MQRCPDSNRVLLIEDDPWVQSILAELLTDEGYHVARALTGHQGLRLAEQFRPALIVLDLQMPDASGRDVLRTLKDCPTTRHIPVLVVSAHLELLRECEGCAEGVHRKPFDVTALLAHVQRLVPGPPPAAPGAAGRTHV